MLDRRRPTEKQRLVLIVLVIAESKCIGYSLMYVVIYS